MRNGRTFGDDLTRALAKPGEADSSIHDRVSCRIWNRGNRANDVNLIAEIKTQVFVESCRDANRLVLEHGLLTHRHADYGGGTSNG
jgi:hypothetical protein